MSNIERDDEIESMFSDDIDDVDSIKAPVKTNFGNVKKPVKKSGSSSLKKSVSSNSDIVKKPVKSVSTDSSSTVKKSVKPANKGTDPSSTVRSDSVDSDSIVKRSVKKLNTASTSLESSTKKSIKKSSNDSLKTSSSEELQVKNKAVSKDVDVTPLIKDEPVRLRSKGTKTKTKVDKVEFEEEDMFAVLEKIGDNTKEIEDDKAAILYFMLTIVIIIIISMIAISMNKTEDKKLDSEESPTSVSVSKVSLPESEPIETVVTSQKVSYGDIDTFSNTDYTFLQVNRAVWATYDNYNPVKAFISVSGTDINYNVFQADDNEKFLEADGFGEYSDHGSIFADYRNNLETLDENNVIYGHNMADGTMFAGLLKLRDSSHYVKDSDFLIYLDSRGYNNVFKIFSVYEVDLTTFNFIQTGFEGNEKQEFLNTIKAMNQVDVLNSDEVSVDSKLITLSTCTQQGTHRVVVHGYLVAREVAK